MVPERRVLLRNLRENKERTTHKKTNNNVGLLAQDSSFLPRHASPSPLRMNTAMQEHNTFHSTMVLSH